MSTLTALSSKRYARVTLELDPNQMTHRLKTNVRRALVRGYSTTTQGDSNAIYHALARKHNLLASHYGHVGYYSEGQVRIGVAKLGVPQDLLEALDALYEIELVARRVAGQDKKMAQFHRGDSWRGMTYYFKMTKPDLTAAFRCVSQTSTYQYGLECALAELDGDCIKLPNAGDR